MPAADGSSNMQVRQRKSKFSADVTALKPTGVRITNTNKAAFYRQPLQQTSIPASTGLPSPRSRPPAAVGVPRQGNQRSTSAQRQQNLEPTSGRQLERAQSMPSLHAGNGSAGPQRARSTIAARRTGPPPHERSRSPSVRCRELPEPVAEPVEDSSVDTATHASTNTPRPNKKRSRSKSSTRERSTSCSRREEDPEAADNDEVEENEGDDEEVEEKEPMTLTVGFGSSISVRELEKGMRQIKHRLDAIVPVRDKLKKQFDEIDREISDIETMYKAFAKLRKSRLKPRDASPSSSRSKSKSRLDVRSQSSKPARGGDDSSEGEENEVVLLDPVDPAVAASRKRHGQGVLELGASPARQFWGRSDVPKARVDHNRNAQLTTRQLGSIGHNTTVVCSTQKPHR